MKINFNEKLIDLCDSLPAPLYAVGGIVRNFLIDGSISSDYDLAAAIPVGELERTIIDKGFEVLAVYPRTNTLVFKIDGEKHEYTAFRKESYKKGGVHTPETVEFTTDIVEDAKRRDFKCNAIYYDIKKDELVDPLGGIDDVKNRVLDTVDEPEKVFSHDGLRLMRLARFCGELNFKPTNSVLEAATKFSDNVKDISPERIFDELKKILISDKKYAFSNKFGHYEGIKLLEKTRVLDKIIPELTLGRGMAQRKDYHNFDVLEHSLKTLLYAEENIRLTALLHDVGKPYCMIKTGQFYKHDLEGEKIALKILDRLKADNKTKREVAFLIKHHMLDMDLKMREGKLKIFFAKNYPLIEQLLNLKQADFKGSKEQEGVCPTVIKWQNILVYMQKEGAPLDKKQLKISAKHLVELGFKGKKIGEEIEKLFLLAVENPSVNDEKKLFELAKKHLKI